MRLNLKAEPCAAAWGWRFLLGPASILDGLAAFFTVGTLATGASLGVARRLSKARFSAGAVPAVPAAPTAPAARNN